jgi:hypothetical protein
MYWNAFLKQQQLRKLLNKKIGKIFHYKIKYFREDNNEEVFVADILVGICAQLNIGRDNAGGSRL